jgi:hypothetical protein
VKWHNNGANGAGWMLWAAPTCCLIEERDQALRLSVFEANEIERQSLPFCCDAVLKYQ